MQNIREEKKQKYVLNCISHFFYKGLKCEDLQKRHRKQIYDQIKIRYKGLYKIFFKKIFSLKEN